MVATVFLENQENGGAQTRKTGKILYEFLITVKAAPHECVIRTGQP